MTTGQGAVVATGLVARPPPPRLRGPTGGGGACPVCVLVVPLAGAFGILLEPVPGGGLGRGNGGR